MKKARQIVKMKWDKNDKERIKCIVYLLQVIFILWSNLISQFVLLCCKSHYILSGSSGHIPINPSSLSYCFYTSIISLTFHVFLLFLWSNTAPCCFFSYQHSSIITWREYSLSWKHRESTRIHFNLKLRHQMRPRWIW